MRSRLTEFGLTQEWARIFPLSVAVFPSPVVLHKVSSISVPQCVMLFRTLHCVKYYTTVLTNRLDGNHSGKINSILYQVHTLHAIFAMLTLNLPTTTIFAQPFNVIKWQLKFNPVA